MSSFFSPKITQPRPQVSLGQRFNNLPRAALLTSLVQYDKILSKFGQEQLVMVNYVCGRVALTNQKREMFE